MYQKWNTNLNTYIKISDSTGTSIGCVSTIISMHLSRSIEAYKLRGE